MASTATTFSFALKERFSPEQIEDQAAKTSPTLGMIPRKTDLTGTYLEVPISHIRPQGLAVTRANSQDYATNVGGKKFLVTTGDYSGTVKMGRKVMLQSKGNEASWLENKATEIEQLHEQALCNLSGYLWGNGGGAIGTIGSISGDEITLGNVEDAIHFEENLEIAVSANDGTGTGHTLRTGTTTVSAVNRAEGKITITASELTGETANDYIFRAGDFAAGAAIIMYGFQYQLSGGASPGDLYTVTRTTDPTRLAGCWVQSSEITAKNIEGRIKRLGTVMQRTSGRVGTNIKGFLNPTDWEVLEQIMSAKGYRSLSDDTARSGYQYIEITAGGAKQRIYSDPYCPVNKYHALDFDVWKLGSLGPLINVVDEDGLVIVRGATADTFEYRLNSYPALYTRAPVRSGVVSLA